MARRRYYGRRRRGGRRGFRVGKYVNLGFKILGAAVAAGPAIKGVSESLGNPQGIPKAVAFNYTGLDIQTGAFNYSQAMAGIGSVIAGVFIGKIGSFLGRRF